MRSDCRHLQVLVFASRGAGQSAVFFLCFSLCGWLTLAMLARGQGPRFTLQPGGGAVVDGLGNFNDTHFVILVLLQSVVFLWSSLFVFFSTR